MKDSEYIERFLFRKRKHRITKNGIRTIQNSFFRSSDVITNFDRLGNFIQYEYKLKIDNIIAVFILSILGSFAIAKNESDQALFAIGFIMLLISIYLTVSFLVNIEYSGSYYFSSSTFKSKGDFEIKSNYPANENLSKFLCEIRKNQKEIEIQRMYNWSLEGRNEEGINTHLDYLSRIFEIDKNEIEQIKQNLM